MSHSKVRVRFAPSPTGPLHMGGVRTALFNYLFAKKHGGDFLLRIEDTDQTRFVPGAEEYIVESLKWCGLKVDEGISAGGEYGPYKQSERKPIYKEHVDRLIEQGMAYYAFDTTEELDAMRERLKEAGVPNPKYDFIERGKMVNSLTLSAEEVAQRLDAGEAYVVRFKMPQDVEVKITDIVRGEVVVNTNTLDDKVLFKSDGLPTYHLANVVDDFMMKISHVIRGEEWLPSTPLHVLLYEALGYQDAMPQFAHMPLTLKPDGKGKLSKRDGDRLGFPVFPLQWSNPENDELSRGYREDGYFPEAFVNMLAFLGWNPGTEQEIFSMDELIEAFSLERVIKSGAKFDPTKAKWFNEQYLRKTDDAVLADLYLPILTEKGVNADKDTVARVVGLVKERVQFVAELWDQSYFFFETPKAYDPQVIKKRWKESTPQILSGIKDVLLGLDHFTSSVAEEAVKAYIAENELGMGAVMNAFRLVIVGAGLGPHLFDILEIIGKEESIKRIEKGLAEIKK